MRFAVVVDGFGHRDGDGARHMLPAGTRLSKPLIAERCPTYTAQFRRRARTGPASLRRPITLGDVVADHPPGVRVAAVNGV